MMENVKISVIIPAYNCAELLPRAVFSILMQEFSDFEVIIVNDGSTDDTGQVCADLSENDMRVRVINKENGGVSSARNVGLDAARGEYVMFVDADDAVRYGALEHMYRRNSDMVIGGFAKLVGRSIEGYFNPSRDAEYTGMNEICRFLDMMIKKKHSYLLNSVWGKLFRRSVIREHGLRFDEDLRYGEDKLFTFRFLCYVNRVAATSETVYDYIIQPMSLGSDLNSDGHVRQLFMLLERYIPLLDGLRDKYPSSRRLEELYHVDVIGRYVCRILTVFLRRRSECLTEENISLLYSYMSGDERLGVFSVRPGQILNVLLYKIGKPSFTVSFYRLASRIFR